MLNAQVGIPNKSQAIEAVDSPTRQRPPAAAEALRDRNAMFQLEARAVLEQWAEHLACESGASLDEIVTADLLVRVSESQAHIPPGLVPKFVSLQVDGKLVPAADDCPEAVAFFETVVRKVLLDLDTVYAEDGSRFSNLAPSSQTVEFDQWCLAWTQASVAVGTEWMFRAGEDTLRGAIRALWVSPLPQFRGQGRNGMLRATLPNKLNNGLRFDLSATPVVCQVLDHDVRHWQPNGTPPYSNVQVLLSTIDTGRDWNGVYYRGRNVGHIYLAIWLERMGQMLAQPIKGLKMAENTIPPTLPPAVADNLVQAQFRGISALISLYEQGSTPVPVAPGYFAGAVGATSVASEQISGAPWPVDLQFLDGRYMVIPTTREDLSENSIGRIRLQWDRLSGQVDAQWIDLAIVVRWQGQWEVLPVEMVDQPFDEVGLADDSNQDDSPYEELMDLTISQMQVERWPIERLRQALPTAEWAFRRAGLGVFLSGALDLDSVL
jgi:hypothetical protein